MEREHPSRDMYTSGISNLPPGICDGTNLTSASARLGLGLSVSSTMETKSLSSNTSSIRSSGSSIAPPRLQYWWYDRFHDLRFPHWPFVFLMSLMTSSLLGTKEDGLSLRYRLSASSPSHRIVLAGLQGTWNQSPRTRQLQGDQVKQWFKQQHTAHKHSYVGYKMWKIKSYLIFIVNVKK